MPNFCLEAKQESFPLLDIFTIARGSKTHAHVIFVSLTKDGISGQGEGLPYNRYQETPELCLEQLNAAGQALCDGLNIEAVLAKLPFGAARNALDCAFWDWQAKSSGRSVAQALNLEPLKPLITAYTISLDDPEIMAHKAAQKTQYPVLKLKIGRASDIAAIEAVHKAVPQARLIIDGNESLSLDDLNHMAPDCAKLGVGLIEQPLAQSMDEALFDYRGPIALCADESLHTCHDLERIHKLYKVINVKLDKTGGLTEALVLKQRAQKMGLGIMVGCMVATSLSIAPAFMLAQDALWVDLDGALLLSQDRNNPMAANGPLLMPPSNALWG